LELQDARAAFLDFRTRCHRDKWQIIHTWLLGARRLSDCSDVD
jgi:hypothetical protein